jgi:hypothetical protein
MAHLLVVSNSLLRYPTRSFTIRRLSALDEDTSPVLKPSRAAFSH